MIIEWLDMTLLTVSIALFVTTLAATLQATIGFGFAVLSVPVLALLEPRLVPVPQLLLIAPLALGMALRERAALQLKSIWWVVLGRISGAGLGVVLLKYASQFVLDLSIAGVVIVAVLCLTVVPAIPRNPFTEIATGLVSGTGALVSSIGGPPLALLYRDAGGSVVRSTLATIFILGLVATIGARVAGGLITESDLKIALTLLPAVGFGFYLSRFLIGRIEGAPFKRAVLVVATVSAIALTVRAFLRIS